MKIESTYYKDWLMEMVRFGEQAEMENVFMSDAERDALNQKRASSFEQLNAALAAREANTWYIPNPIKKLVFRRLCEKLSVYAEQSAADLAIETTKQRGIVRLGFGQLILDGLFPAWHNRLWKQLLSHADAVWMDPVERYGRPAIQCTFVFDFMWAIEKGFAGVLTSLGVVRTADYD